MEESSSKDTRKSGRISRIRVGGYDTSYNEFIVKRVLTRYFGSCGKILYIFIPKSIGANTVTLNRFAFMYIQGEYAQEKALALSGHEAGPGGVWKLVAEALPFLKDFIDPSMTPLPFSNDGWAFSLIVTGFDTSPPRGYIKRTLLKHFSSCGDVPKVVYPINVSNSEASISFERESALEKALELSGMSVEGYRAVVVSVIRPPDPCSGFFVANTHYSRGGGESSTGAHMPQSGIIKRICVEGYDTSLPDFVVEDALRKHFASCGDIPHVYVPKHLYGHALNRCAFIYLQGEDAEEKALKLSGSYVGGCNLAVKALPFPKEYIDRDMTRMSFDSSEIFSILVTGFDTSFPQDYVINSLWRYFSSCGKVVNVRYPLSAANRALVYIRGEGAVGNALELSGCYLQGWNAVVVRIFLPHDTYLSESGQGMQKSGSMESFGADTRKSGIIKRICVEGYDTLLSDSVVKDALSKHFASCGSIPHIYIPNAAGSDDDLHKFSLLYIKGEDAEEKALKLSGSDVGGWNVVAKALPFQRDYIVPEMASARDPNSKSSILVAVTGYDTSLPRGYVGSVLTGHFSSCGEIGDVTIPRDEKSLNRLCYISMVGEEAVDKALELSGSVVDGWTIDIVKVILPRGTF